MRTIILFFFIITLQNSLIISPLQSQVKDNIFSLVTKDNPKNEKFIEDIKISNWKKEVKKAELSEKNFSCEKFDKRSINDLLDNKIKFHNLFNRLNFCIKKSDVLKLGKYEKYNEFHPNIIKESKCKDRVEFCLRNKSSKLVYQIFVQKGKRYHARYPGEMIKGMVWFELMYLHKLKQTEKSITRYLTDSYDSSIKKVLKDEKFSKFLGNELKRIDEKKLYSLIKLNKSRQKMRQALGFSIYDDFNKVINSQWELGKFLNKDKLKVMENDLSPEIKERQKLIENYRLVLAKYKLKLEEEKQKNIKK